MRMGQHRFLQFPTAKGCVRGAIGHQVAGLHGIFQPELHGVHAELLRQFVDHRLNGQGRLGLPRRPVPLDFLFVTDDVVAIDQQMRDLIGAKASERTAAHWRAGKGTGFKG